MSNTMIRLRKITIRKLWNYLKRRCFVFSNRKLAQFASLPTIDGCFPNLSGGGRIKIGKYCHFRSFRLRQFIVVYDDATLEIGDNCFMNDGVHICASLDIRIGNNTKIGDMTYIYDTNFHTISPDAPIKKKPVYIGNNVWIGANCMILAGSNIGDHAVIAAGSIVTGTVPPQTLVAGIPASVIKSFNVTDGWIRD